MVVFEKPVCTVGLRDLFRRAVVVDVRKDKAFVGLSVIWFANHRHLKIGRRTENEASSQSLP